MLLINKKIYKSLLVLILFIGISTGVILMYFSPLELHIKINNFFNSKVYLTKNKYIKLPKGWYFSINSDLIDSSIYIQRNCIIDKNISLDDISFIFIKNGNYGTLEFFSDDNKLLLTDIAYKEYDNGNGNGNGNCKFKVFFIKNKTNMIYIPKLNIKLTFAVYNEDVNKFLSELCD